MAINTFTTIVVTQNIRKTESGIPLDVIYNPAFRNLSTALWKMFNILYSDAEVRTVFTPSPFAAYRSAQNLKSFLVKPIYPLERTVGSSKCGSKRCLVCLYVSETDIFESIQTKHHCKINHHLDCNDKYLI